MTGRHREGKAPDYSAPSNPHRSQVTVGVGAILINRAPNAVTQQTTIASVSGDQPFLEATTEAGKDRLYVGYNNNGINSTVLAFLDAKSSAAFTPNSLDVRFPSDMPPTRTAIHSSGTIYCAFYSYDSSTPDDISSSRNVVVVKDLDWPIPSGASAMARTAAKTAARVPAAGSMMNVAAREARTIAARTKMTSARSSLR